MEDVFITTVSHRQLSQLQAALEFEKTARLKAEVELARLRAFLTYHKLRQVDARNIILSKPRECVTHTWKDNEWIETSRELLPPVPASDIGVDWMEIKRPYHQPSSDSSS